MLTGFFSSSVVDAKPCCCCPKLPPVHGDCLVPRLPFHGVWGADHCSHFCASSGWGPYLVGKPLSLKHYLIWNGLVNCVQLLNLFYIFICLL